MTAPREADDLGLSVCMLDVDRLRDWSRNITTHGADISHWSSPAFIVTKLDDIADRLDQAVREIGTLRGEVADARDTNRVHEDIGGKLLGEKRALQGQWEALKVDIETLQDGARKVSRAELGDLSHLWRGKAIAYETVLGAMKRLEREP